MRKTGFRLGGGRAGRRGWRSAAGAAATLAVAVVPSGAVAAPAFEVEQLAEQRGISVNEAERRLDAQARMPELESTMRDSLGTSFGGIWVDTDDGDTITVGVASADAGARAQARAEAAAFDIDVDFRTVRYTARELDDAATWLSQRLGKADAGAKYPLGAGIRTDLNVVEIQAPAGRDLTAAQQDVVDEAEARFGDLIRLGEYTGAPALRACVYAFCDPPLRGGIRLLRPNQDAVCTGGFVSRGRGSNNYLFLMTAGHCATAGTWYTRIPGNALRTLGP